MRSNFWIGLAVGAVSGVFLANGSAKIKEIVKHGQQKIAEERRKKQDDDWI
jgi:hypothetical protein